MYMIVNFKCTKIRFKAQQASLEPAGGAYSVPRIFTALDYDRPVERGRGEVFPRTATFGGLASAQKILTWVFQMASF